MALGLGTSDNQVDVLIKATADVKAIDQTSSSLNKLESSAGIGSKATALLGVAGKAAAVGVAAAGAAIAFAGNAAITSSGSYEQSRIAFETMLGSADKARNLMQQIAVFAKETPFELPEVVQGTKQLLAFGFAQEDLLPTMRKLGDLASGLGVPVGQLTNVFGQVRVAGRLMGQDLLQFTNAGVPLIEALATTMKKPQSEIKKLVEEGKVGFPEVETAINSLTGEGSKFGGMMEKQSHTFNGVVSNIKDGFGQMLRAAVGVTPAGDIVAGGVFDRIKSAAEKVMPIIQNFSVQVGPVVGRALDKLSKWFNKLWPTIEETSKKVSEYLLPKFKNLFDTIETKIIPILKRLWNEVIEPLLPVIGTLLVGAIGLLVDTFDKLLKIITPVFNFILNHKQLVIDLAVAFGVLAVALNFNSAVSTFLNGMNQVTGAITGVSGKVTDLFTKIGGGAVMGGIVTAGAMADIALVAQAVQNVIGAINAMNQAKAAADRYIKTNQASINELKSIYYLSKDSEARNRAKSALHGLGVQGFAKGVRNFGGGLALVGEQGPELVNLPRGADVYTNSQSKRIAGGANTTNIYGDIHLNSASAVDRWFERIDRNNLLAQKGLTPIKG